GAGIAGVGVVRHGGGDNGDIDGIAHPKRLMQNAATTAPVAYRERLTPSLWLLASAAVAGPMVALTFTPVGQVVALLLGAAAALAVIAALVAASPVVSVEGTVLRAGRAHIDARWLGETTARTGDAAR